MNHFGPQHTYPDLPPNVSHLLQLANRFSDNVAQYDTVWGLVSRAEYPHRFFQSRLPFDRNTQLPAFEAVLGPGIIYRFTGRWLGQDGEQSFFHIGWKLRTDRRVNEVLLQLYPACPFAMDIAVTEIEADGEIRPLFGWRNRVRALAVVRR